MTDLIQVHVENCHFDVQIRLSRYIENCHFDVQIRLSR